MKVRQALAYATPYDQIIQATVAGFGGRVASFQLEGQTGFIPLMYSYDLDKAKALLKEAGYPDGFKMPALHLYEGLLESSPIAILVHR